MTTPFGPQLIGQTEKTLNALLADVLGDRLSEPQWVTLRLAHQLATQVGSSDDLACAVADQAKFADAAELVRGLTAAGLLEDGLPTVRGRALVAEIQAEVAELSAPIFTDLPESDVAGTTRVLNEVLTRTRAVLA
jgi:hypothetical protein